MKTNKVNTQPTTIEPQVQKAEPKPKKFRSIPIGYVATRHHEKKAQQKQNAVLAKALDAVDRRELHSIPGQVDAYEEARLKEVLSATKYRDVIQVYRDGRFKLDKSNRRTRIIQGIASFAGSAVAIGASFLSGGGLAYLGISIGIGVVGFAVNRWLGNKIKNPRSVQALKDFDAETGKIFEDLDRKVLSRSHWTDKDEFVRLSPEHQKQYTETVQEIEKHNKSSKRKSWWSGALSKVASYAGLVLPMVANLPGLAVNAIMIGGVLGGNFLATRYTKKIVPVEDGE